MRRRTSVAAVAAMVAVVAAGATPASAETTVGTRGWVPAPQGSFEQPAGARCDFAIRSEPVRDEVRKLVLDTNPDGSPRRELYAGDLIVKVTNTDSGASTQVDASGTAMIEYYPDGSQTWYANGPALFGFRQDGGTLPRGYWLIDGQYMMEFSPTFYKTLTMVHGTTHNVCEDLD
ncbi:hypothetical protein [Micromonospora sp. NPDC050200]|uniref:hypothetical protein n=1 Tax=Micromonospora sp. NPDC050200 TaxID=3155664 RepID=UPI00340C4722